MKRKIKANTYTILIFILSIITCFSILSLSVKADSGWDSDYDSGYDGGGFDFDYGGSYSSGDGDLSLGEFIFLLIFVVIVCIVLSKRKNKQMTATNLLITTPHVDDVEIKKHTNLTTIEIEQKIFDIYQKIQVAWMNFDYETLRKYTSDEMFNMYKMQLETLKLKHQKNIMSDFNKKDIVITEVASNGDLVTIKAELVVAQKDYVVNDANNVVNGSDKRRVVMHYELTFTMTIKGNDGKCPNCGAKIANQASNVCEYCNSVIVSEHHDLIMTKKEKKGQSWE